MIGRRDRLDAAAMALMVLLCACWGLNQVAIKLADDGISPVFQAGLRSTGAVVLVWAWSAARGVRLFARDGTLGYGLLVGALFAGEFVLLYWGLVFTTASRGAVFLYMAPFIVAVGAHLLIPGERLRRVQAIGLLCAFAGTAAAFSDALRLPTYRQLLGDSMTLGAALLWGATTLLLRTSPLARVSPHKALFYQLGVSAVLLLGISRALGEPGFLAADPLVLGALAYQIVVVAFATYLAWFWLISRYPAVGLSAFSFLTPLFGLLAGATLLGEPITPTLAAAMLLVGLGIQLVNRPSPARRIAVPETGPARQGGEQTG